MFKTVNIDDKNYIFRINYLPKSSKFSIFEVYDESAINGASSFEIPEPSSFTSIFVNPSSDWNKICISIYLEKYKSYI